MNSDDSDKDPGFSKGLRPRPVIFGLLIACIASAIYLMFILYVDSDIEKQTRKANNLLAAFPTFLALLHYGPLYSVVEQFWVRPWEESNKFSMIVIPWAFVALAYFGVGMWAGHVFRDKAFKSKMHVLRFSVVVFLFSFVGFIVLGGVWWYFACKSASC